MKRRLILFTTERSRDKQRDKLYLPVAIKVPFSFHSPFHKRIDDQKNNFHCPFHPLKTE